MRNRLQVTFLLCSLAAGLLFFTTCTDAKKESTAPDSGTLTSDSTALDPDTLTFQLQVPVLSANPLTYDYGHERWIIQYTHAWLYLLDKPTMTIQPELALEQPTMSEDKLTWTIPLRRDARWHDGKPLTAKDVEASFRMLMGPAVDAGRQRAVFSKMKNARALDDYTVEFTYSEKHAHALQTLLYFPILPAHVLEKLEKPGDLNDMKQILGSGPYRIVGTITPEAVVLERNDDWFGEKPKLKRIVYQTIRSEQAAASALIRGEVDAMGVPHDQWVHELSKDPRVTDGFLQLRYHRPSYKYFGWNCARPVFSDKRTRKALAMAFDVQKYLTENFSPGSVQVTGPFFFKGPQHDPQVKPLPYDPAAAARLLAEVGWTDSDGDGILDRDGEKFEFTVIFAAVGGEVENRAAALKDACRKLGIQVTLRGLDTAAMNEQLKQKDFDCVAFGLAYYDPEFDPYQLFHTDAIDDRGSNYYQFSSDEADDLMERARVEFDSEKRNALYHELHRLIYDEQPFLFLVAPEYLLLVNKRFSNARAYGLGLTPRIGIEWSTEPFADNEK